VHRVCTRFRIGNSGRYWPAIASAAACLSSGRTLALAAFGVWTLDVRSH